VALVTKVAVFHSGGHTETGGLLEFLRKLEPDVEWMRRLPAVRKPSPKLELDAPGPAQPDSGVTGEDLVDRMIERLAQFPLEHDCGCILIVDDADCRFTEDDAVSFDAWRAGVAQRIARAVGRKVSVHVLLASPEIEAWLVSDWEESFGHEYPAIEVALRRHLRKCRLQAHGRDRPTIEAYGGRRVNDGCERKLSDDLARAVHDGGRCSSCRATPAGASGDAGGPALIYSKRYHASAMLKRIRPERVREHCVALFAPAWQALRAELDTAR
jgi:hypothetical protein